MARPAVSSPITLSNKNVLETSRPILTTLYMHQYCGKGCIFLGGGGGGGGRVRTMISMATESSQIYNDDIAVQIIVTSFLVGTLSNLPIKRKGIPSRASLNFDQRNMPLGLETKTLIMAKILL